jgi:hypothetical protein
MSTRYRAARRATASAPAQSGRQTVEAGAYLTDGVFLYRVTGFGGRGVDETVELEDCYLLDVVEVSMKDLRARRLRAVTPATADA